ncbi:MAG: hypothetical protein ABI664_03785 [bacterium]
MPKSSPDDVTVVELRGLRPAAAAPPRARAAKAGPRGAKRAPVAPDVGATLAKSLAGQDLELAKEFTFIREPEPPQPNVRRARGLKRASAPVADDRAALTLNVALADGEDALILLEEDGVFSWHVQGEDITPPAAHHAILRQRAATGRRSPKSAVRRRVKRFALSLPPAPAPQLVRGRPAVDGRKRGLGAFIAHTIVGQVTARVFRFVAGKIVGPIIDHMERNVLGGMVKIDDVDCTKWRLMDDSEQLALPKDRPPLVLMLVHGTFSSTMGGFGGLSQTPHGKAVLKAALKKYDVVIGFDHKTLSVTPMQNATDLLARLERQKWPKPPIIDAISHSRGGLVFRSLVEAALPVSRFQYKVNRAVFVACTNAGTELARRKNWDRMIDRYTNLAAGASKAVGMLTGSPLGAKILGESIRGVGAFVKALALAALDDNKVPGLEAMDPAGAFVRQLNDLQEGQPQPEGSFYCVMTSNFDPDTARRNGTATEFPPSWWLRLGDKPVDELMGKANDLVVDVDSMSQIDVSVGDFVKDRFDFGTNGTVYHTNYFLQKGTAIELTDWLQLQ